MKYAVGCDPNAARLKNILIRDLESMGHKVEDFGSDDPIYANTAFRVAGSVVSGASDMGLLVCGTGIGMSIAANKVKGAYAALVTDMFSAERARKSNNANIICMGENTLGMELARALLRVWNMSNFDYSSPSAVKVEAFVSYDKNR